MISFLQILTLLNHIPHNYLKMNLEQTLNYAYQFLENISNPIMLDDKIVNKKEMEILKQLYPYNEETLSGSNICKIWINEALNTDNFAYAMQAYNDMRTENISDDDTIKSLKLINKFLKQLVKNNKPTEKNKTFTKLLTVFKNIFLNDGPPIMYDPKQTTLPARNHELYQYYTLIATAILIYTFEQLYHNTLESSNYYVLISDVTYSLDSAINNKRHNDFNTAMTMYLLRHHKVRF